MVFPHNKSEIRPPLPAADLMDVFTANLEPSLSIRGFIPPSHPLPLMYPLSLGKKTEVRT